ncbi:MAG: MerR family transcriptional regulator [Clostridiales bacterium]|nr:MerR family transcriptional regulator [Clostridiales bacterium]MDU6974538.1 MerR family transcriptional regulator [Clostridiales bacterium]
MNVRGRSEAMYRIGEFSKMSKTTIKTLHYYDEIDLLKPEYIDPLTNYRFYTTNQLVRLHHIQSLRQIGLVPDEIKLILSGASQEDILHKRKAEVLAEIENAQQQLSRIEFILSGQEEETFMNYQATIKELPECIVYSKKMTIPNYNAYFQLIPAIGEKVMKRYPDLKCATPEYCFIVYPDGEYKEQNFNVEFCEAVTEMKENFEDIVFKKIQAVSAVSVMHKGPYAGLDKAYAYAFKWIEDNGYTVVGSPRENYIDGIWNKEDEADWLTELQIPICKMNEIK